MKHLKPTILFLAISSIILSCNSLKTAIFDQYSYQKTIEIKVEAAHIIDKATTPYTDHLQDIDRLRIDIQTITEYEKNKPHNEITYAMWQVLADEDKNLLVGFLNRWQEKGQLNPVFVEEAKAQIMQAMDLLIQYEAKKDKETKDKLLQLLVSN